MQAPANLFENHLLASLNDERKRFRQLQPVSLNPPRSLADSFRYGCYQTVKDTWIVTYDS